MNELEMKLNLAESNPIEKAFSNPTADNLKAVPKINQSEKLVMFVCSHDGMALEYVSKKLISFELCEKAVEQNGLALQYVPPNFIFNRVCEIAVSSDGRAIEYVPEDMRTLAIVDRAVEYCDDIYISKENTERVKTNGVILKSKYPIAFVPLNLMSKELLIKAVTCSPFCLRDIPSRKITKILVNIAINKNGLSIKYVPKRYITRELVDLAVLENPISIRCRCIPDRFIDQELCNRCFEADYSILPYIAEQYITEDMCLKVIEMDRFSVLLPPEEIRIRKWGIANIIVFGDFPERIRNNTHVLEAIIKKNKYGCFHMIEWSKRMESHSYLRDERGVRIVPLRKETIDYLRLKNIESPLFRNVENIKSFIVKKEAAIVPLQDESTNSIPVFYKSESLIMHEFSDNDASSQTIYYITDIHIEHQLCDALSKQFEEVTSDSEREDIFLSILKEKIDEMLLGANDRNGVLLIGGDIADSIEITVEFYQYLFFKWKGTVISVLGNHELWDGTDLSDWENPDYHARPIDDIVNDYKSNMSNKKTKMGFRICESWVLENELFVWYKNDKACIISEKDILNANNSDLKELLSKCSLIVLGGIGYSGLNPVYNSEQGLYRKAITSLEEDKYRTERFRTVYDKIMRCAYEKRIIVLTHTPVSNWTLDNCNPNWIYINGHTHHNLMTKKENGTTVLSDNQIGYEPKKWKLNAFTIDSWYDPFDKYEDGIHEITSEEYKEFNRGRGINCKGCNYEGTLFALKSNGMYMFLLRTATSLCLMFGGQRKKLDRYDVQYYYDNMASYGKKVLEIIKPYQNVMNQLSEEVKRFGGIGTIHGCIVDISWFSHIYVNPLDGEITSYWALNTESRLVFKDLRKHLKEREPELLEKFLLEYKKRSIPLIGKHMMAKNNFLELAVVPQWVLGTEIYKPSKMLRSVQYLWEQNVIRMWNDDILKTDMITRKTLERKNL